MHRRKQRIHISRSSGWRSPRSPDAQGSAGWGVWRWQRHFAEVGVDGAVARGDRQAGQGPTRYLISAVSNRGLLRLVLDDGGLNVDRFITFLRRLIRDARQKVFLVVDNLKVHHARKVKTWVHSHRHEIELFYLLASAPEHNPDEYLNHDLKQQLRRRPQAASKAELLQSSHAVLRSIQRSAERIRAYFRPGPVQYAA